MKKIAVLLLMLVLGLSSFAGRKRSKKKVHKATHEILSVSLYHTACYGKCPVYKVYISKDGTTTYNGMYFTDDSGVFVKNIGTAKAMEIISQFSANHVDTCKDSYEVLIPDLPGINLTITYADGTKTINNAGYGPGFLRILSRKMDEVGKKTDDTWKRKPETGKTNKQ